ncbi:MAG: hypothetical protein ACH254_18535, partial [Candidatus Thiodiazotropha endolucinida]
MTKQATNQQEARWENGVLGDPLELNGRTKYIWIPEEVTPNQDYSLVYFEFVRQRNYNWVPSTNYLY